MNSTKGYREKGETNPGTILGINTKYTRVLPVFFDGLGVSIHRGLSSHFKVHHSIFLSSITPGNYRFGAAYAGDKVIREHEGSPVIFGDTDVDGNMNATFYHLFGSRCKLKYTAQLVKNTVAVSQLETHYFADSFTLSAVLAKPDLFKKSGVLLLQYLQSVSSSLDIGLELAVLKGLEHFKENVGELKDIDYQPSIVGRYRAPRSTWCAVVSQNNLLLSCYQQASHQVECGIELNTKFRLQESIGTFATKVRLHDQGVVFRAMVDSKTNVGSVFEKRICGSPMAFAISTNLNFKTSNFRLGLGVTVE